MKQKIVQFLSRLHYTRYIIARYHGTEYEYERYYGFYVQYSPCAVGMYKPLAWNRRQKLSFTWGTRDLFTVQTAI